MKRAAMRALAGGAEGDVQRQQVLIRRMGLARVGCPLAIVGQRGLVAPLQRFILALLRLRSITAPCLTPSMSEYLIPLFQPARIAGLPFLARLRESRCRPRYLCAYVHCQLRP